MPSRKLFSLELIQQVIHPVGIDTRLKAIDESADLELLRLDGLLSHSEADSQGLIDRGLQSLAAVTDRTIEPFSDVGIQSESGPHEDILMPH